jgi:hypothetical protein
MDTSELKISNKADEIFLSKEPSRFEIHQTEASDQKSKRLDFNLTPVLWQSVDENTRARNAPTQIHEVSPAVDIEDASADIAQCES